MLLSFCGQNPVNLAPIGALYAHVRSSVYNAPNLASLHVIFHSLNYDRSFTAKRRSLRHSKVMKLWCYVLFKTIFL